MTIFVAALFIWLSFVYSAAWSVDDRFFPAILVACVAYSLAMCKLLSVAPLARPFITVIPMILALGASWGTSQATGPFSLVRAVPISQSVALTSFAYLLLAVSRVCAGYYFLAVDRFRRDYVFHTPDGGTDGWNTDKLYLDFEMFRSRLIARRNLKILFPNTEWEEWLKSGFQCTRDEITFADLSPENIRTHDLVVPLKLHELAELDQLRGLLANNPIPVPSRECIALCDDKYLLNRKLVENGFGAHIPDMGGDLPYPYILKKRSDEWAVNSHVISSPDLERAYSGLLGDPDYFRQAFVPGKTEYTTHVLVRNRKIVAALTIKFVFKDDLHKKGRENLASYSKICRSSHLKLFAAMLRSIDFEGLCCINYKIADGGPRIFEINPRFGASLVPSFGVFVGRTV